ncbi:thymidylate synthase [Paenibacillus alvei]|uniref:thymidylate synthase n=1 Tax=Paenibacillus alvei TaxID=44250 RepID=UPI0022811A3E|nr:thymidylate synthase [Paenibacillus alvei]MCY9757680.1 thymidylate synthase [Paenibacillus alvei]
MNKADEYFVDNIIEILEYGHRDENPRPRYASDGAPAHSIYITQVFETYNLEKNEFPITTLRPINIENAIKELEWIYKDQTSVLKVLTEKYNIHWWEPWSLPDGTIGRRYGETVQVYDLMNKLLKGLVEDPFGRRHIINLWQEQDFIDSEGLLPCAFMTIFSVVKHKDEMYLDMTLVQRSSDYLVAGHINKMQYVAFQMMVAKHCGYKVGKFCHFVQNLHIYDRHVEQANRLLCRRPRHQKPKLVLNVPEKTNFYDISHSDFELIDYDPVKPQLKFELGV